MEKDVIEKLQKLQKELDNHKANKDTCPNCGYCPHCGRGGQWTRPWYPYPWYPQPWYYANITTSAPQQVTWTTGYWDAKESNID